MVTYVWSVNTQNDRDKMVAAIYDKLTTEPSVKFTVAREGVSSVVVYDSPAGTAIRKYVVIVIPVIINLNALDNITGHVVYNLDETILSLQNLISKTHKRQGKHFVKGSGDGKVLEQAIRQLVG